MPTGLVRKGPKLRSFHAKCQVNSERNEIASECVNDQSIYDRTDRRRRGDGKLSTFGLWTIAGRKGLNRWASGRRDHADTSQTNAPDGIDTQIRDFLLRSADLLCLVRRGTFLGIFHWRSETALVWGTHKKCDCWYKANSLAEITQPPGTRLRGRESRDSSEMRRRAYQPPTQSPKKSRTSAFDVRSHVSVLAYLHFIEMYERWCQVLVVQTRYSLSWFRDSCSQLFSLFLSHHPEHIGSQTDCVNWYFSANTPNQHANWR